MYIFIKVKGISIMKNIFKTMIFSIVALTLLIVLMIKNDIQNEARYNDQRRDSNHDQEKFNTNLNQETTIRNIEKMSAEDISNELDKNLMESGIIDSSYIYTDSKKREVFFERITENLRADLPSSPDEYGVITKDFEVTPYQITQIFVINSRVSDEEAEQIRNNVQTEEYYKAQCSTMYNARYQRANNTNVKLKMFDLDNKLILESTLNKAKCP